MRMRGQHLKDGLSGAGELFRIATQSCGELGKWPRLVMMMAATGHTILVEHSAHQRHRESGENCCGFVEIEAMAFPGLE